MMSFSLSTLTFDFNEVTPRSPLKSRLFIFKLFSLDYIAALIRFEYSSILREYGCVAQYLSVHEYRGIALEIYTLTRGINSIAICSLREDKSGLYEKYIQFEPRVKLNSAALYAERRTRSEPKKFNNPRVNSIHWARESSIEITPGARSRNCNSQKERQNKRRKRQFIYESRGGR